MILYLAMAVVASALMALGLLMMKTRSTHLPKASGANTITRSSRGFAIPCGSADSACRRWAGPAT